MRSIRNPLCVAFFLAALPTALFAQANPPAAATQTQPIAPRPAASQPGTFEAHVTLGPAVPIPEAEWGKKNVCASDIYGLAWDGVNNGLWIVLKDRPLRESRGGGDFFSFRQGPAIAVLLDPVTGEEKKRLDVPSIYLIGHDGVGLWFETSEQQANGKPGRDVLQRIRTAPTLARRDQKLPEDLAETIPIDSFRVSPAVPESVFSVFRTVGNGDHPGTLFLSRWSLDAGTINAYGTWIRSSGVKTPPITEGAGYLWITGDPIKRLALAGLAPMQVSKAVWSSVEIHSPNLFAKMENLHTDDSTPIASDSLTWDGQRLWSFDKKPIREDWAGSSDRPYEAHGEGMVIPPVHLVSIDVGLTRKPDTTARHNKALAFERKNGTLKAIPLFEQIIADDPAAAEVRNHLGWALATRPQEPYHDIPRAKKLVETALQWQPWDPEKWDTLAEIYWRLGDAKLAEHLEAKAINLNPTKTFYWRQLDKFRAGPTTQEAPEPAY